MQSKDEAEDASVRYAEEGASTENSWKHSKMASKIDQEGSGSPGFRITMDILHM
jgi:hypothetical protein